MKINYKSKYYRIRRKYFKWYLSSIVVILGIIVISMLGLGFHFFYPKGIDTNRNVSESNYTLRISKSDASNSSSKNEESSKTSKPQISSEVNSVEQTTTQSTIPSSSLDEQQADTLVTYSASVGGFTRVSTVSQEDAQQNAQSAYDAYQAQVKANQVLAESIKESIERSEPETQVNIIEGKE